MLREILNPFFLSKIVGKKYVWQKASLEGVNWICFFAKKQIQFTPSKKNYPIYYLPNTKSWKKIIFKYYRLCHFQIINYQFE